MKQMPTPTAFLKGTLIALTCSVLISAQAQTSKGWIASPFDNRVFVENKGQFDQSTDDASVPVYYGARVQGQETYFTAKGVVYQHGEVVLLNKQGRDSMIALNPFYSEKTNESVEEKENTNEQYHFSKTMPRYLKVEWLGANPNVMVDRERMVDNYFTYPKDKSVNSPTIIANAFQKITYRDMYPGIDIEYIIPKDKEGLKYSLILHPGADLSKVKMKYTYEKGIELDKDGNVVIQSQWGEFVDHAPISFYQSDNTPIATSFQLDGDVVSFKAADYNNTKTVIVDPWTTNPNFPVWNRAYDVVYDKNGNVWAYGGNYPWQLAKFSPAGALLWTYSASGMYNSGCCTGSCYGDVAVDETSGSCYLSEGFDWSTGSRVFKVNTAGVQVSASVGNPNFNEIWRMEYNRCINVIVGTGGGTSCCYQAIVIDTTFTTMTPVNVYGTGPGTDNWGMTIDPTTPWVYLSTTGTNPNPMIKCPIPALLPLAFNTTSGFSFTEIGSVMYATGGCCANGFNGMSASLNWLYGYDGTTLKKFNKGSGALVSTIGTGGTQYASGGTTSDICDNVYVGVGNQIKEYSPNLTLVTTLATAGTTYDVKIGPNNGKIYASGDGFVQELTVQTAPIVITHQQTPNNSCTNCNGTATCNVTICGQPAPNVGYNWSPSGQTTQTATGLCAGNYTVTISTACGVTMTDTMNVMTTGNGGFTLTMQATGANCSGGNATATATPNGGNGPFTYSWNTSPVQTTQTATGLGAGNYTCYVTDANGCTGTSSVQVINSPPVTLSVQNTTPATCFNGCNGTATVQANGGTGPFNYSWSTNPAQLNANATGLCAGTYTCFLTDASGCTDTSIVSITQPTAMQVACAPQNVCAGGQATLTANINGGSPNYTVNWQPGNLNGNPVNVNPNVTTTYTITVTDANGCVSAPVTVTVTVAGPITTLMNNPPAICSGAQSTLTCTAGGGGGQYTYLWAPGGQTTSSITVSPTVTTTYTITVNDNCPSPTVTDSVTVTVNPTPTVAFVPNDSSGCVPLCITFANNSSSTATCSWTFGDGGSSTSASPLYCYTTPGTYNVSLYITDANGCTNSLTVNQLIQVYPIPMANFTMTTTSTSIYEPSVCFADASVGATILSWDFGDPLAQPVDNTSTLPTPCHTYADTGQYCVSLFVQNNQGCRDTIYNCLRVTDIFTFYAPNSFTPNNDGFNDTWLPKGVNIDPSNYHLWVFDRWGNLIWDTNDLTKAWPGTANGGSSVVQEDVYVWKIKFSDLIEHKNHQYVGHISVIK